MNAAVVVTVATTAVFRSVLQDLITFHVIKWELTLQNRCNSIAQITYVIMAFVFQFGLCM